MRSFKMSNKMSTFLKLLLVLLFLALCALFGWALVVFVLSLSIQWWAKAMILTCLGATVILIILFRKLWIKHKEMKFVDGIIGSDKAGKLNAIDDASRELRRRFKEAVTTLKKSHLKGKGNPLYVLPWYMIVGKSGSGKSTAVKSARLPSPFGDINRISGVEGTRNCDWWFFDDSVVIDTAGRYCVHRNEDLDKSEWLSFLEHLAKYRKKEPINGVIVTVEADQLLQGDLEKVEEEGRTLRKRIDEVIYVMGAKFPIYLLVTKCDLIYGMDRFCRLLSESTLEQAMGMMNHDGETDIAVLVDKTINTLVDKLKDIRLLLANREDVRERHYVNPEVLLFPDELARLRKGLMAFCKGAFKDNPFQELPPLRGVYFCSGQQAGRPVSSHFDTAGKMIRHELPGTGNGFFLHDFFAKILPLDRPLYALTRQAREWHRLTHNLWLTGAGTVALIFCILLTHSWNENRSAINTVSPEYRKTLLFKNEPVADIATMAEFRSQIKNLERINASWRTPRLGLKASITLEKDLKHRYCQRFYEHFDADINNQIEGQIADGGWKKNNADPTVRYIPFITRRINLLNALFKGVGEQQLAQLPDPDYALTILNEDKRSSASDTLDSYKETYITYLIWQKDRVVLNKTMGGMQRLLANYFSESQGDLGWLPEWANRHLRGQALTMNSFWRGTAPDDGLASVKPAYTLEGRKLIGHFVTDELDSAVAHSLSIVQQKESFVASYQDAYYGAWLALGTQFEKGLSLFKEDSERLNALERLASENSPYMQLIQKMAAELFPTGSDDTWPTLRLLTSHEEKYDAWLTALRNITVVRHSAIDAAETDNKVVKQLGNKVAGKVRGNTAVAAKLVLGTLDDSKLVRAREAFMQYQKAMAGFTGITTSLGYAHQVALSGFSDNPAEAISPLYAADRASASLRSLLSQQDVPVNDPIKDPFWCLFQEPLDALWRFTVLQAGCRLQELWDEEVIVRTHGVHDQYQLTTLLFGDRGLADQYMYTHARPFVQQSSARGYHARERQNVRVPFQRSFFDFIRQGKRWNFRSGGVSQQQNFNVTVRAYPTDVNAEAKIKPYMTRLMVDSSVGATILENKQYPVEKKFHWSAAGDGSVLLQIHFENVTLTQRYTGYCAFGKFLRDFSGGRKTYTADQFPNQEKDLNRFGVKQIDVIFQFDQSQIQPVMRLLDTGPGQPPQKIINCKKSAE